MDSKQLHAYIFEARRLYLKDTGFKITSKGVQFYPNETSNALEDFYMPIVPDMINQDVFVWMDTIGERIKKWREYNENNREIHVMSDPTIGKEN